LKIVLKKHVTAKKIDLDTIILYYCQMTLFKIMNCNYLPQLKNILSLNSDSINYNLRNNNNIKINQRNFNKCLIGFQFSAPIIWNALSNELRNLNTLDLFKNAILPINY